MGLLRSAKGQSLVEFALVLGVLILMLMGIFDFGRAVYAYNVIANCAWEGARYGIIKPMDTAGIEDAARARAVGLDPSELTVNISYPDGSSSSGSRLQVQVTYNFRAVTPLITNFFGGSDHLTLQSTATMHIE